MQIQHVGNADIFNLNDKLSIQYILSIKSNLDVKINKQPISHFAHFLENNQSTQFISHENYLYL